MDKNAGQALGNFQRFPRWMWRNIDVLHFVEWLKRYNEEQLADVPSCDKVGIYGLDLYSLQSSMNEVVDYLERMDPRLAEIAKQEYACFDNMDSKAYGRRAGLGLTKTCELEVIGVLQRMLENQASLMSKQDKSDPDTYFYTLQNARVVKGAESYYRNAYSGRVNTWNIRDRHMLSTLVELLNHLSQISGQHKKAVVWAHNSHLGDASQTENKKRGKINLGQLVREYYGIKNTFNIGFTTYTGSVTAADNWGEDPQFKIVNEGMENSHEKLFHEVCASSGMNLGDAAFCMLFRSNASNNTLASNDCIKYLSNPIRLERAIGVVYRPKTERQSHYFHCCIPKQFDAVIHIDTTEALHPLEYHPQWVKSRMDYAPATYPGLLPVPELVDAYDTTKQFKLSDTNINKSEVEEGEEASRGHSTLFDRFLSIGKTSNSTSRRRKRT